MAIRLILMYFNLIQLFQNIIFLTHSGRPPDAINQKISSFLLIILLPFSLLITGCGGGGATTATSTYSNTIEGDYGTEYNNQVGLAQINATGLNNYGHTGAGIKVAVIDTGIDSSHTEFNGKTMYGRNFGGISASLDAHGHGTHVASIIAGNRDASGMRGIAYNSELYIYNPLATGSSFSFSDTNMGTMYDYLSTDNIRVSNHSYCWYNCVDMGSNRTLKSNSSTTTNLYTNASVRAAF